MIKTNKTVGTSVAVLALGAGLLGGAMGNAQAAPKMSAMSHSAMSGQGASMMAMKPLAGSFKQVTHATKGRAKINGRTLTLSSFETGMGPQLHVYLVPSALSASNMGVKSAVKARHFVDLGALKSIKGTQSYKIPTSVNTKGQSVVIWCDKFDVVFGTAALASPQ